MESMAFHRTFVPETSRNKGVELNALLRGLNLTLKTNSNYRVKIDTSLDLNYTYYVT